MDIIDTHAQLWTEEAIMSMPEEMREGYLRIFGAGNLPKIGDTIQDMDAAGVSRSVVVAIDAETRWDYKVSNELVAETVAAHPDRFIGFASVDPHKGVLARKELRRAVEELGMRGLKLLPHLLELRPNDREMYPVYEEAGNLGIPVLFHAGTQFHTGTKLKYCQPIDMDEVAVDFPDLKIIIAHFGWPWYEETMTICQRNVNVWFNIAGWAPRHIPEFVIRYIDRMLSHKVLLGSDYPLVSRQRIVKELEGIELKEETRHRLYSENAVQVLGL
ncbi:MAG: amidohydrolase family protein [Actinomycetota bacterium]|nr:amidohydrolase family protein [Actinomycetota bacterium]